MSIRQKTISGLAWSFIDNFAGLGVNFVFGIILARLLLPKEYGLIGMTAIFMAVSQAFVDSGFGNSLIRKPDCGQKDFSTVFYFNLAVSICCYALLFISAGTISRYFKEPQLLPLIRVLAVSIIINGFGAIQRTILIKHVDFKKQAKINVISNVISGCLGIVMAYRGHGVWSLAWMSVMHNFLAVSLLWTWSIWRPAWLFDRESFKEMFGFGSKLLISGLIDTIYRNVYYLVIGKYFSATELGYYTRAMQFQALPSSNITGIIQRVSYPVLAQLQGKNEQLKAGYQKLIKSSMFISFVLMVGMAASAKPMVLFLIGEKWLTSAVYLQMLCFAGMFYPIHALNLNMLNVKGRSDLFLKLEVIKKLLAIPTIVIGIFFGIKIMIAGMMVNTLISYYLNSYWSGILIGYPMKEQVRDIAPSLLLALGMGAAVYALSLVLPLVPGLVFGIQVLAGAGLTIGLARLFRVDAYLEMQKIAKEQWIRQFKTER